MHKSRSIRPTKLLLVGDRMADSCAVGFRSSEIVRAATCEEAELALADLQDIRLIRTRSIMADGNWCDVLRTAVRTRASAELHVIRENGDSVLRWQIGDGVARFTKELGRALASADAASRRDARARSAN